MKAPELEREDRDTLPTTPGAMPCMSWACESEARAGELRCERHAHERTSGPPPSEWLRLQAAELAAQEAGRR